MSMYFIVIVITKAAIQIKHKEIIDKNITKVMNCPFDNFTFKYLLISFIFGFLYFFKFITYLFG